MTLGLVPHDCSGKALATILLTTVLACILRGFRVRLPQDQPDVEPVVGLVVSPRKGVAARERQWCDKPEEPSIRIEVRRMTMQVKICFQCGQAYSNTGAGLELMYAHLIEEHKLTAEAAGDAIDEAKTEERTEALPVPLPRCS